MLGVRPVRVVLVVEAVLMGLLSSWYCHSEAEPISLHEKSAEVCARLETEMLSGRGQGMLDNEILSTAGGGVAPPEPSHRKTNARWYMPAAGTVTTSLRLCQSDCRLSLLPPSRAIQLAGKELELKPDGTAVAAVSVSETGIVPLDINIDEVILTIVSNMSILVISSSLFLFINFNHIHSYIRGVYSIHPSI